MQVRIERIDTSKRQVDVTQRSEEEVRQRQQDKPAAAGKPDKWIAYNPTQAEETEVRCW